MSEITGVEEPQAADAVDVEDESQELTLPAPEDDTSEDIEFADLFEDEDAEEAVEETTGDDNPPESEESESESSKQQEPQKQQQETKAETPGAFAKRLSAEKRKMESTLGMPLEEAAEIILESKARKLMDDNKDMNMTLDVAKRIIRGEQPAPEQKSDEGAEQPSEKRFEVGTKEHVAWWKQRIADEEPLLQAALNDPNMTVRAYAKQNPAFDAALRVGNTPIQALKIAQSVEPLIKQQAKTAAADAQKEMLKKIGDSNARAVTPVNNTKTTGKPKSVDDWLKTASLEDMREKILQAERRGSRGINLGKRDE